LLGDHLDSLRNDILPLGLETQSDPTEFDLGIVVVLEMVQLLQFGHLSGTKIIEDLKLNPGRKTSL